MIALAHVRNCKYAYGMDQQITVRDIEERAYEERVSLRFVCQRAGVHPTTFFRWKKTKKNPEPVGANLSTVKKLYDALDDIAAENKRRRVRKAVAA